MSERDWEAYLGKTVLIGLTSTTHDGVLISQEQFFGKIVGYRPTEGIELTLLGAREGQDYRLPPDLTQLHKAAPGEYRLRATGEVVIDPDYTSTWTVARAGPSH
jgi:hypothetical protein